MQCNNEKQQIKCLTLHGSLVDMIAQKQRRFGKWIAEMPWLCSGNVLLWINTVDFYNSSIQVQYDLQVKVSLKTSNK